MVLSRLILPCCHLKPNKILFLLVVISLPKRLTSVRVQAETMANSQDKWLLQRSFLIMKDGTRLNVMVAINVLSSAIPVLLESYILPRSI